MWFRERSWNKYIKVFNYHENFLRSNIYIQSNELHNVVALIKFLLVLRCQLDMFRTVTVHPQELLCRYCMCRLWYVVRSALSDTSSWYNVGLYIYCKNATRTFQCQVPKIPRVFFPAIGSTGVISVRCQLSLCLLCIAALYK